MGRARPVSDIQSIIGCYVGDVHSYSAKSEGFTFCSVLPSDSCCLAPESAGAFLEVLYWRCNRSQSSTGANTPIIPLFSSDKHLISMVFVLKMSERIYSHGGVSDQVIIGARRKGIERLHVGGLLQ